MNSYIYAPCSVNIGLSFLCLCAPFLIILVTLFYICFMTSSSQIYEKSNFTFLSLEEKWTLLKGRTLVQCKTVAYRGLEVLRGLVWFYFWHFLHTLCTYNVRMTSYVCPYDVTCVSEWRRLVTVWSPCVISRTKFFRSKAFLEVFLEV